MSLRKTNAAILHVTRCGPKLLGKAPHPGARLDILVTDTVARYWILDRPSGLASTKELDLLAAERFSAIYGEDPAAWAIRADPSPWSNRWLACAIPRQYATELPHAVEAEGWRVRQVQSRYIREFNRCCRHLEANTAFCVAARECTTIGLIVEGEWHGIRVHPPLTHSTASFAALLQRDCRQAELPIEAVRPIVVGSLHAKAC